MLCDGRTGIIVDDSVASIAGAVGQLLDVPDHRTAMGMSARIRCESEFSLDVMAQRWRTALQPMVSPQVGTPGNGVLHAGATSSLRLCVPGVPGAGAPRPRSVGRGAGPRARTAPRGSRPLQPLTISWPALFVRRWHLGCGVRRPKHR